STTTQSAFSTPGPAPASFARALDACLRAAAGEQSNTSAIVAKSTENESCSTNATRSAGASRSSTTCSAAPIDSSRSTSSDGPGSGAGPSTGSVGGGTTALSRSRQRRVTTVVSQAG